MFPGLAATKEGGGPLTREFLDQVEDVFDFPGPVG